MNTKFIKQMLLSPDVRDREILHSICAEDVDFAFETIWIARCLHATEDFLYYTEFVDCCSGNEWYYSSDADEAAMYMQNLLIYKMNSDEI